MAETRVDIHMKLLSLSILASYHFIKSGALPSVAHDTAVDDVDGLIDAVLFLVAQLHLHRGLARQQSALECLVSNDHLLHLLADGPSRKTAAFVEASLRRLVLILLLDLYLVLFSALAHCLAGFLLLLDRKIEALLRVLLLVVLRKRAF